MTLVELAQDFMILQAHSEANFKVKVMKETMKITRELEVLQLLCSFLKSSLPIFISLSFPYLFSASLSSCFQTTLLPFPS